MSDPYVVLRLGREEYRTKTVQDNLHPVWNTEEYQFQANVRDPDQKTLHVKCWDENPGGEDTSLGVAHVNLVALERNEKVRKVLALFDGGVGQIEVELEFTSKRDFSCKNFQTSTE